MKVLFFLIIMISNTFASSPKRTYTISDLASISILEDKGTYKKISILVGVQRKNFLIQSINNLCLKKDISCKMNDDNVVPLSKIILEISGNSESLKNIEKLIN